MTRREGHLVKIGGVPGGHDDPPVFRTVLDLAYAIGELIDTLSGIVGVHVDVLGTKVAPLKAVHRPKVAFFTVAEAAGIQKLS